MKKNIQILILLLFIINPLLSYEKPDSLELCLKNLQGADRIEPLNKLANEYRATFPERTIKLSTEALEIARGVKDSVGMIDALMYMGAGYSHSGRCEVGKEKLLQARDLAMATNYDKGKAFVLRYLGVCATNQGKHEKAFDYFRKSAHLSVDIDYYECASFSYTNMARLYNSAGHYDKALEYFNKALKYDSLDANSFLFVWNYQDMGNIYKSRGDYEKAVEYFVMASKRANEIKGFEGKITYLKLLGTIYHSWERFDESKSYYLKALELILKQNDKIQEAQVLSYIGYLNTRLGKYDEAMDYLLRALNIFREMEHNQMIAETFGMIALNAEMQKNYKKALHYYKLALLIYKEMGNKSLIARSLMNIGNVNLNLDKPDQAIKLYDNALVIWRDFEMYPLIAQTAYSLSQAYRNKGDYETALKYISEAENLATIGNVNESLVQIYSAMSDIFSDKQDYYKAFKYRKLHDKLKDSLGTHRNSKDVSEVRFMYELEKKETEIKTLSKDKEIQEEMKNYLIIGFTLILLIALILYGLFVFSKRTNRLLEEKNVELGIANEKLVKSEHDLTNSNREKDSYLDIINNDLNRAADYVASLLPPRINNGAITTNWELIPSSKIGGDSFGYHWMDDEHFAFYLLDVSGHGVGSALHSVSVLNVLRFENLPDTDYRDPVSVLTSLNKSFMMKKHNNIFFTIWYGVYNKKTRTIRYSSAGHPPALMLIPGGESRDLNVKNYAIAGLASFDFKADEITIPENTTIFVYSDGVYEIRDANGQFWEMDNMTSFLKENTEPGGSEIIKLYKHVKKMRGHHSLDDDFTMLKIIFK